MLPNVTTCYCTCYCTCSCKCRIYFTTYFNMLPHVTASGVASIVNWGGPYSYIRVQRP